MSSADLNLQVLTIAGDNSRSYATSTIKGAIFKGGSNINGFPLSNYAKYAYTLLTRAAEEFYDALGTIKEGDRITDQDNVTYEVLHVDAIKQLNNTIYYVCELLELTTVTYYRLTNPSPDPYTGQFGLNYYATTLNLNFSPKNANHTQTALGSYAIYDLTALTSENIHYGTYMPPEEGDLIQLPTRNANLAWYDEELYEVTTATNYHTKDNTQLFTALTLTRKDDMTPYLSGTTTWHTDSDSLVTDPRYRIKTWIQTYINGYLYRTGGVIPNALFTTDDGTTAVSYHVLFNPSMIPLTRIYKAYGIPIVFTIDKATVNPRINITSKIPYGFEESVPITINVFSRATKGGNKAITATRLLEQAENELRRISTGYAIGVGTFRGLDTVEHKNELLGQMKLCSTTFKINYIRPNDDYTNSGCTVTWGPSATPTGTFTFPNITKLDRQGVSFNIRTGLPGRLGQWTSKLGLPDHKIELECDLDLGDWKRPQNGVDGSKTDTEPWQFAADIHFNGQGTNQPYQMLNVGTTSAVKAVLDDYHVVETSEGKRLQLTFYTYSNTAPTTYTGMLGL